MGVAVARADEAMPPDFEQARLALETAPVATAATNSTEMHGYAWIRDIHGRPRRISLRTLYAVYQCR